MKDEREVAGIRCSQVLARLSEYLDGELDPGERERIELHVRDCPMCTRFGGVFAATILGLRSRMRAAQELPNDVADRLAESLRRET